MRKIVDINDIPEDSVKPYFDKLRSIYDSMDRSYRSVATLYGFDCKGCEDSCCQTRFYHHTLLEYLYLKDGFDHLPNRRKNEILQRILSARKKFVAQKSGAEKIRVMCPLNDKELCSLYPYRPMICRLHGIPHMLYQGAAKVIRGRGCDVFMKHYSSFAENRLDRTPFYKEMAQLEIELRQKTGYQEKIKMTIADMILSFNHHMIRIENQAYEIHRT